MKTPDFFSSGTFTWWAVLSAISAINLVAWAMAASGVRRRRSVTEPGLHAFRRWQLGLSGVFVAVCAFRAVFPRADVQRICLHDSWLSSVMVGRSLATVAEICFVAQWALLLRALGKSTSTPRTVTVSRLLVPLIVVAEICSWYAVLTTSYLGNAVEESIWAITALLATAAASWTWSRLAAPQRPLLLTGLGFGLAYVTFMATVDVPMYLSRWLADRAVGRNTLGLIEGIRDVSVRWVVTHGWEAWRTEIPWMTLYFTVTVWFSIALMTIPAFSGIPASAPAPRLVARPATAPKRLTA